MARRTRRAAAVVGLVALALVACSQKLSLPPNGAPGTAPPTGTGGGGGNGDAGPSGCGLPGTPADFALPTANIPLGALTATSGQAKCMNGATFHWSLFDLDGDQQPDLVVDSACDDTTIGPQAWRVYKNVSSGFADPVRFALPLPALDPMCTTSTLMDVDGDLRPDLLVTKSCIDTNVGTTRWLVYPNTASGFGTPVPFALPTGFPTGAFATTENDTLACPRPVYAFYDADGDRKPDLVVTTACDDATVGTTAWRIYKNVSSGVAPPSLVALPKNPTFTAGAFGQPHGGDLACDSARSTPRWSLLDFDGDFSRDIVMTQTCGDPTVGSTAWLLYRGVAGVFDASPTRIALPVVPGAPLQNAFLGFSATASCNQSTGEPEYSLVDVNGDFKLDLLVTRACGDTTTGVTRWLAYPSSGTSFATTPRSFSLPAALGGIVSDPIGLTGTRSCTGTPRPDFTSGYLTRLRFDVIATSACVDTSVGTTHWQVYESSCP